MNSSVKLISISKPVIEECETAEELIAYCARVSNPNNQANHDTSAKLLKYCADNGHWSIFEMVHLVVEIKCTRDIGRQILRHSTMKFQEFSQRYSAVTDNMFSNRECRLQDNKNRQNSIETDDRDLHIWFTEVQNYIKSVSTDFYTKALDRGIAKEQARCFLPEGLTMSRMYMTGNLRSFIHYCKLRRHISTQKEHREIANQCWEIVTKEFPSLTNFLE